MMVKWEQYGTFKMEEVILMTKAFTVFMFCINYSHDVCVCHLILQHSFVSSLLAHTL